VENKIVAFQQNHFEHYKTIMRNNMARYRVTSSQITFSFIL